MRKSFWIPKDKRWMQQAINKIRRDAEEQGIPLSESDVIVMLLEENLQSFAPYGIMEETEEKVREKGTGLKRTVRCRAEDNWLVKAVDKIVDAKNKIGIKSNFSYELFRLAKNGFLGEMKGYKIDRSIFDDADT